MEPRVGKGTATQQLRAKPEPSPLLTKQGSMTTTPSTQENLPDLTQYKESAELQLPGSAMVSY